MKKSKILKELLNDEDFINDVVSGIFEKKTSVSIIKKAISKSIMKQQGIKLESDLIKKYIVLPEAGSSEFKFISCREIVVFLNKLGHDTKNINVYKLGRILSGIKDVKTRKVSGIKQYAISEIKEVERKPKNKSKK